MSVGASLSAYEYNRFYGGNIMAYVLALLASGRRKGFTSSLLESAVKGAESVPNVDVEFVHLHKYKFGPCTSCFNCIRDEEHDCTLPDAMGGKGELMTR